MYGNAIDTLQLVTYEAVQCDPHFRSDALCFLSGVIYEFGNATHSTTCHGLGAWHSA